jgi:hypothetical protein
MKHSILFTLALLVFSIHTAFGQEGEKEAAPADTVEAPWKKGGVGSINFNQVSLNNWAAGGNSSVSGGALLNAFANYSKDKVSWDNTLDLAFGVMKQGDDPAIKNDDRIEFSSKYGKKASDKWSYSGQFLFRSQFAPGFDDPVSPTRTVISDFLSPAYLQISLGMDYKPTKSLSVFISPVTDKTTIVTNQTLADAGAFGVEAAKYDALGNKTEDGSNVRFELGGYSQLSFKEELMKNVGYQTKLELFSNYLNNPQNIDVNWTNLLSMKVNKYISASVATQLIYDHDILIGVDTNDDGVVDRMRRRTQFKEALSIGFSYKFYATSTILEGMG